MISLLDFKYDIIFSKIINESTVGIEFEEIYGFKKDGESYSWNPEIRK